MIDFTSELVSLNVTTRIEQALQSQPFIEVSERDDLGKGRRGNVPCKCWGLLYFQKARSDIS